MTDRSSRSRGSEERGGRSSGGRNFSYQRRDADTYKKRSEGGKSQFDSYIRDNVKMFKPKNGDNVIRILPPTWDNPEHFGLDLWVHYNVGPDNQAYLCAHKMKGEQCPICDERAKALENNDSEYADQLKPTKRVAVWMIDRNDEKEGPILWTMPWTIDRDICKLVVDKRTGEVLPIDHPEEGYDIEFERKGQQQRTEYIGIAIARRSSDLGDDKWLDYIEKNPITDLVQYFDYDHIMRAFAGGGKPKKGGDDDDHKKEDRGSSRRSSSRDDDDKKPEREERGGRSRREEPKHDWDSIHKMTWDDMCDLVEAQDLKIKPDEAKDEDDLADWICEEMKIEKAAPARRSSSRDDDDDKPKEEPKKEESSARNRLRSMREGRE